MAAVCALDAFDETAVAAHDCGMMDSVCPKCGALYFLPEARKTDGVYTGCCQAGKVALPAIPEPPHALKSLFTYLLRLEHLGPDGPTGRRIMLPRITLTTDDKFPFVLRRRQFPIRPAFAMTINKAQGQTLQRVGVYLPASCFTHGQLYVAASRVGRPQHLRFAVPWDEATSSFRTRNVVYPEALTS